MLNHTTKENSMVSVEIKLLHQCVEALLFVREHMYCEQYSLKSDNNSSKEKRAIE